MSDTKKIIEVKHLSKRYGNGTGYVLNDIDLSINEGDFVSIMGQSGCGKSTLLYLLGGLDTPTSGEVFIGGKNIAKMSDAEKGKMRRSSLGFVFQFYNLVQNLTVRENILLPAVLEGGKESTLEPKLIELLELVGLTGKADAIPRELSGGQQQRVSIARALIASPKLILADESIGNLDSKSGTEVMELFQKINTRNQTTIVQVTHSVEASHYGTHTIYMKDGMVDLIG